MTETISFAIDSEDLKEFKTQTGMSLADCVKILINSVKYGGKLELDPFWSDENQKQLRKSIAEFDEGKTVEFTAEEWEKFVNAQEIQ
ncbi:MAG: hypothetical protein IJ774_13670 [Selenomonadaceae bacterium]|nr:hypothetical protein [Selenomonadaceae bacterium]